ncbi:maleylpyruvate isomerase family mycothiol-dependent enzyme [Arsenicicoccus dermatophilus]|uniref:maleylpyruvate isomerase family mycothiol-dependent enzyme n=1 Tax=Arsenicicoccus dermatophilus TaxID=1076331 RepID=UPI001F4CA0D0|nr:maleylpyruvate isomerase family mycothiol-dependent enzyme [Arsenicicoccus dermatophilus]MCH8614200.1 maleylpyruvate isomerase family mycothiol-dependent enzyme [Arsenicicoccus dermatophilus]
MNHLWTAVADLRGRLADDLATLGEEQWRSPSWCAGWTVEDVVAHLSASASTSPLGFVTGLAAAGLRRDRHTAAGVAANRGATPSQTFERYGRLMTSTLAPPGPTATWLGEIVVHGEDIRRPLGLTGDCPRDLLRTVAVLYQRSDLAAGSRSRIRGLRLQATDDAWTHGRGELVEGPLLSLVLAMTGRGGACADLTGPGVPTLLSRCSLPPAHGDPGEPALTSRRSVAA